MQNLTKRAITNLASFHVAVALMIFLPAGTVRFWEAWAFWILFTLCGVFVTSYFLKHDPDLVEGRLKAGPHAEREKSQKIIQTLAIICVCGLLIVPGIERRFHASVVPLPLVLVADALVVTGYVIIFLALRENKYAYSTIEVKPGQHVISTGPYRLVRHPFYSGAVLMFLATSPALGSLWAVVCAGALFGVIVARLLDEERYLSKNLPGYEEYCGKVRCRLIPRVW